MGYRIQLEEIKCYSKIKIPFSDAFYIDCSGLDASQLGTVKTKAGDETDVIILHQPLRYMDDKGLIHI